MPVFSPTRNRLLEGFETGADGVQRVLVKAPRLTDRNDRVRGESLHFPSNLNGQVGQLWDGQARNPATPLPHGSETVGRVQTERCDRSRACDDYLFAHVCSLRGLDASDPAGEHLVLYRDPSNLPADCSWKLIGDSKAVGNVLWGKLPP